MGGERAAAWFNYLQEEGFYPIIVTRCWNEGQSDVIGELEHNEYSVERVGNGEIHRVPVPRDLRNKIDGPIRKLLTLRRLLSRNTDSPVNEFKTMYDKCVDILKEDPEIKTVIASGRPFESFQIGYLLKKEFDITWIPDYRDEWNTHQLKKSEAWIWRKIAQREKKFEKLWCSNADSFITVSNQWARTIGNFIQKEGFVIKNGIKSIPSFSNSVTKVDLKELTITYVGTVYRNQPFEPTFEAIKKFISKTELTVKVYLLGTETIPREKERLYALTTGFESNFNFIDRLPTEKLATYLEETDVFILTPYLDLNGCLPVKIYDYLAYQKPIILFPSDNDLMEEFILSNKIGHIPINQEDYIEKLTTLAETKIVMGNTKLNVDKSLMLKQTRKYQTKLLADLLNSK